MRIVVYSAWFGSYEPLNRQSMGDGAGYDRVLFTDEPDLRLEGVRTVVLPVSAEAEGANTHALTSRVPKLCPHRFFSDYDWAIYVDNTASLKVSPAEIIRLAAGAEGQDAPPGRYLLRHQRRVCAYKEARVCMKRGRIPRKAYRREVALMRAEGFPEEAGLYVNTVLVQRMGDPATDRLNEVWLDHVCRLSGRDQISLPFELWRARIEPMVLPVQLADIADWPIFRNWRRVMYRRRHGGGSRSVLVPQTPPPQAAAPAEAA